MKGTHYRTISQRQTSSSTLIALPVFNEEHTVHGVFEKIREIYRGDILFLDDGSTDGSRESLLKLCGQGASLVGHERNLGYGQSIMSIFEYAIAHEYDHLLIMDGDGQHDPGLIPEFFRTVQQYDVVSGSRYFSEKQSGDAAPEDRRRINVEVTRTINQSLGLTLTDAFCGFKAYRVSSLNSLKLNETGYGFPLQFWVQAVGANLSISEISVPRVYLDLNRSFGRELDDPQVRFNYYMSIFDQEFHRVFKKSYRDVCRKRAACCKCSTDDGV